MGLSLQHLNERQREAVLFDERPLLVLAGAGTGKTSVITHRIAHFVHERAVAPERILAVTFTNKAARQMRERATQLLAGGSVPEDPQHRFTPERHGLHVGTFHRICGQLLRRFADRVGLAANFTIYDADEQLQLIKQCMQAANIDPQVHAPRAIRQAIEGWKNAGKGPDAVQTATSQATARHAGQIYALYQARLRAANAVDFSDMLRQAVVLLEQHDDVRQICQRRWTHLLVDEYQDTNPVQYAWLRLLTTPAHSLTVVGDDDQSIYRWRGADIGNILRFERDFPGAAVVRLEQNYRSTNHILRAANGVIAHNAARKGKNLFSAHGDGERVRVALFATEREEAETIAEQIVLRQQQGEPLAEMAILYRTNGQSRPLEDALRRRHVAYTIVGGVRFYDRKEVKDALGYLRLLGNAHSDIDFLRIVNAPARGLGKTSLDKLQQAAARHDAPLLPFCQAMLADAAFAREVGLTARALASLKSFVQIFLKQRDAIAANTRLSAVLGHILQDAGYLQALQAAHDEQADERLQNLEELSRALDEYQDLADAPSLTGFLQEASLVADIDALGDGSDAQVVMMTLHAAKGLEFAHVFLPGLEEGLLPHARSLEDRAGLEEERRLCYVGITRAKRSLLLSAARIRSTYGQPQLTELSRFLRELPQGSLEMVQMGAQPVAPSSLAAASAEAVADSWAYGAPPERVTATRRAKRPAASASAAAAASLDAGADLGIGTRVLHATFGEGPVLAAEGEGQQRKLVIDFPEWGRKTVVARFVTAVR